MEKPRVQISGDATATKQEIVLRSRQIFTRRSHQTTQEYPIPILDQ